MFIYIEIKISWAETLFVMTDMISIFISKLRDYLFSNVVDKLVVQSMLRK